MDNEMLKNFITTTGAVAESLYIFYQGCTQSGFEEGQAFTLTMNYMDNLFRIIIARMQTESKGEDDD